MRIREMFAKPVDRYIEGVIKADDDEHIFQEVDEYVVTHQIAQRLDDLLEQYNNYEGANGAWISGFFGSGKSHLLKILSYLLENRLLLGDADLPVADLFLPKLDEEDAMLRAAMEKAIALPSRSILFNIDQKADTVSSNQSDAITSVFMKVFHEMCGYYANIPWLAEMERDLDRRGKYEAFKDAFAEISGSTWEDERDLVLLDEDNCVQALAQAEDMSPDNASRALQRYENNYQLSIEDFALRVKDYIARQEPGFRLNFFVDEVGQYIAGNTKLMTNLQTIAESLATICNGQAWVFVTSQEDMDEVIGEMKRSEANDFSKIQDRFRIRMKLTSANVAEVIQKRLLAKKPDAASSLHSLYEQHKNDLRTLFRFSDNTRGYSTFKGADHFARAYPFQPYQFDLFQSAILGLSSHNAFEGAHRSVGERSMLGVFQDVAKRIGELEAGRLAPFDFMYEGLRNALVSRIQHDIRQAEQQFEDNPLAVRLLKCLLLVKFVKEFRSTPRNLAVLLIDRFDVDLAAHEQQVKDALEKLERQTYVQRNGDEYEFLTNEEKDIETEIKNTDVAPTEINKLTVDLTYRDILGDLRRVRFEDNGQDYSFTRKLDDAVQGREYDLGINLITPQHPNFGNDAALRGNSMGRSELFILLPEPRRLFEDIRLYCQTEKYCSIHQSGGLKENIRQILAAKAMGNRERYSGMRQECADLLSGARLLVNGRELDEIGAGDPQSRIIKGFHELIRITYPNIRMLQVSYTETDLEQILLRSADDLFSGDDGTMSEAETEMLAAINRNRNRGERSSVKKLIEQFSGKPYGWWEAGILCVLARLYRRSKVELREDSNPLDNSAVLARFRNSRSFANVLADPQQEFSQRNVRALKDLHQEFFHETNPHTEARDVATAFRERLKQEVATLQEKLDRKERYPFLAALEEPVQTLKELAAHEYPHFLNNVDEIEKQLLDLREDTIDPILEFMSGPQKRIYDEARDMLGANQANLPYVDDDTVCELRNLLNDAAPYSGAKMQLAKTALQKLREQIVSVVAEERRKAKERIDHMLDRLREADEFETLDPEQQKDIMAPFETLRNQVDENDLVDAIRQSVANFADQSYQQQLKKMVSMARAKSYRPPDGDSQGNADSLHDPEFVSASSLSTAYTKPYLATEDDVEAYINDLRTAMLDAITHGKRINL